MYKDCVDHNKIRKGSNIIIYFPLVELYPPYIFQCEVKVFNEAACICNRCKILYICIFFSLAFSPTGIQKDNHSIRINVKKRSARTTRSLIIFCMLRRFHQVTHIFSINLYKVSATNKKLK